MRKLTQRDSDKFDGRNTLSMQSFDSIMASLWRFALHAFFNTRLSKRLRKHLDQNESDLSAFVRHFEAQLFRQWHSSHQALAEHASTALRRTTTTIKSAAKSSVASRRKFKRDDKNTLVHAPCPALISLPLRRQSSIWLHRLHKQPGLTWRLTYHQPSQPPPPRVGAYTAAEHLGRVGRVGVPGTTPRLGQKKRWGDSAIGYPIL